MKIVTIGGGSGHSQLLRGLRTQRPQIDHLAAAVAVTDNGGSTGWYRRQDPTCPALGDLRQVIAVLSKNPKAEMLNHVLGTTRNKQGNQLLYDLWHEEGDLARAIHRACLQYQTVGEVLPVTTACVHLRILLDSGRVLIGEEKVPEETLYDRIQSVELTEPAPALPTLLDRVAEADIVILAPGSLFTSLIAALKTEGLAQAIASSRAKTIYCCNVSTQRGETPGFGVEEHLMAVKHNVPTVDQLIDYCLVNSRILRVDADETKLGTVHNITTDKDIVDGVRIIRDDLIEEADPRYHDPNKLAKLILKLAARIMELQQAIKTTG